MNQRIRELAEQAMVTIPATEGPLSHTYFDKEKFAGLIVLECMEVFSKDLPEAGDGKMLEVINRVCAVAEHFGVEE
jgi:hypothetical protein